MNPSLFPSLSAPRDGYVFVVTYGRSGSTLLMKLLNSISGACIRGENGDSLTPLLRSICNLENSYNVKVRRAEMEKRPEDRTYYWKRLLGTPDDPWYGAENIDVDDYARSILDAFVRTVLRPPEKVSLLGFKDIHFYKDPSNFESTMSCMLRYFPQSRIIFLTRSIEDVASSGWWKDMDRTAVLQELGRANILFESFHKNNTDRTIMFDYAEFADLDEGVRRIFDFVGADFDRDKTKNILEVRLNHLK